MSRFANFAACIDDAVAAGHIEWSASRNTLLAYFADREITERLYTALQISSRPFRLIDRGAAILDATGAYSNSVENWIDSAKGIKPVRARSRYVKMHALTGRVSSVIAAVRLTECFREHTSDAANLPPLLDFAFKTYDFKRIIGDKAYLSASNADAARKYGASLWTPIKSGLTKDYLDRLGEKTEMIEIARSNGEAFDAVVRVRSRVESVFSAWKRVFGPDMVAVGTANERLDAKDTKAALFVARENEMLAKAVVWNLRRVVMFEALHDDCIRFSLDRAFQPIAEDRPDEA